MKLSDAEKKMVARLQKQQLSWIRWRWVGLLACLMSLGLGIGGLIFLGNFPKDPEIPYLVAATIFTPQIYVTFGTGGFVLIYILWNWNGKPETQLLLKLIDESQKEGEK